MKARLATLLHAAVSIIAVCAAALITAQAQAAANPAALVLVDQAALRAAPRDASPLLSSLWRGESVEVRASRGDWVQVWDAHRERGGYLRATQVLTLSEGDASVAELAAQLRLLRQQPGAESLGLGLTAALIERASPAWLASVQGADMLEALVLLQDRLAARVNTAQPGQQLIAAAHADVAARFGYPLRAVARSDGAQQACPAEQPAQMLRGHPAASPAQRSLAALQLTRADCISSDLPPTALRALHQRRALWLEDLPLTELTPTQRNRLLLRRASVQASLAFARRAAEPQTAARAALGAWTQLITSELTEDDARALSDAAMRVAPMRWLALPGATAALPSVATALPRIGSLTTELVAGEPGETCLVLRRADRSEALRRCSHGLIHAASARSSPDGRGLALAVQPLDGWTELWRLDADGNLSVLPPSADGPGIGVAEFAGWAGPQLLVAREAESAGKVVRRFEVHGNDLAQAPLRWSSDAALLGAFQRSADAQWKAGSPLAR